MLQSHSAAPTEGRILNSVATAEPPAKYHTRHPGRRKDDSMTSPPHEPRMWTTLHLLLCINLLSMYKFLHSYDLVILYCHILSYVILHHLVLCYLAFFYLAIQYVSDYR